MPKKLIKNEVAGAGTVQRNLLALLGLIARHPFNVNTRMLVEVEHQARAIEALTWIITAVFVFQTQQFLGVVNNVCADVAGGTATTGPMPISSGATPATAIPR